MLAMRTYQRDGMSRQRQNFPGRAAAGGLSMAEVEEMYHVMAIANYEDRFVISTAHRGVRQTPSTSGGCGFSFGNGCSDDDGSEHVRWRQAHTIPIKATV